MSDKRIRWLHLSDVHVGKDRYGQSVQFRSLLGHIRKRTQAGERPDFVFFTGDIANTGGPDQYKTFNVEVVEPLRALLPAMNFFAVPGNHDLDHTAALYVYRDTITRKAPQFFDPDEAGKKSRAPVVPKFRAFLENDRSDFKSVDGHHWLESAAGVGVFETAKGAISIGILGLNTAWLSEIDVPGCRKDCDLKALTPGKGLIEQGLSQLENAKVKIVLGHHPIAWYTESDASAIRALLGRSHAIYLHGHLHKTESKLEEGAGYGFRAIQSGALFQAREHEQWVNRILWMELDAIGKLFARPFHWSQGHQDWVIDGDAFPPKYKLPDSDVWAILGTYSADQELLVDPLSGWSRLDKEYLSSLRRPSGDEIIKYFDGRIPSVGIALDPELPRRDIVNELCDTISHQADNVTSATIIIGAAGEGKSTALLQVALGVATKESDWNILYKTGHLDGEPDQLVRILSAKGGNWLICSDDADTVDEYLMGIARAAIQFGGITIHLLCAARDTDWCSSHDFGGKQQSIDGAFRTLLGSRYSKRLLRGLTLSDARRIVAGWAKFGDKAMGQLRGQSIDEAALQLTKTTQAEAAKSHSEGSFFGALLRLRVGSDLKTHIIDLLERLDSRPINESTATTLFEPLALIACMHASNCLYLTIDILAHALGLQARSVRSDVLIPLGEETGVESHGQNAYLLTRHRAVAEAIVDAMQQRWGMEPDDYFGQLVESVETMYKAGDHVPDFFSTWRQLPFFALKKGNKTRAIRLARAINNASPNDIYSWIILSNVYLQLERPELALQTIQSSPETVSVNRRALIAMSNIFQKCAAHACSGIAAWYALSESADPGGGQAKKSLLHLSTVLFDAWQKTPDRILIEGSTAAATLYKSLESEIGLHFRVQSALDQGGQMGIVVNDSLSTFKQLRTIMKRLAEQEAGSLPASIRKMRDWSFRELASHLGLDYRHGL